MSDKIIDLISSIAAEIKDFLTQGRTSDALSRLLELSQANKQIHDSILMVLAEFNDLNAARLRGTITNEEATLRQNKINEKVLMALDSFDGQGRVLPGSMVGKKISATKLLGKLTLVLWGGYLTVYFIVQLNQNTWILDTLVLKVLFDCCFFTFIAYLLAIVVSAFKK